MLPDVYKLTMYWIEQQSMQKRLAQKNQNWWNMITVRNSTHK